MRKILIFLIFILLVSLVFSETYTQGYIKPLTRSVGDTIYCMQDGDCNVTNFHATNITTETTNVTGNLTVEGWSDLQQNVTVNSLYSKNNITVGIKPNNIELLNDGSYSLFNVSSNSLLGSTDFVAIRQRDFGIVPKLFPVLEGYISAVDYPIFTVANGLYLLGYDIDAGLRMYKGGDVGKYVALDYANNGGDFNFTLVGTTSDINFKPTNSLNIPLDDTPFCMGLSNDMCMDFDGTNYNLRTEVGNSGINIDSINKVNITANYGNINLFAEGYINLYSEEDKTEGIRIEKTGFGDGEPTLRTIGSDSFLIASDDATWVRWLVFGDVFTYSVLQVNKKYNYAQWANTGSFLINTNSEADDYINFTTKNNIPEIKFQGSEGRLTSMLNRIYVNASLKVSQNVTADNYFSGDLSKGLDVTLNISMNCNATFKDGLLTNFTGTGCIPT